MRARELEMYANAQPKQYQHRAAEEVCSDRVCHAPSRALTGMLTISSAMSIWSVTAHLGSSSHMCSAGTCSMCLMNAQLVDAQQSFDIQKVHTLGNKPGGMHAARH